jgi:hypothetical protein
VDKAAKLVPPEDIKQVIKLVRDGDKKAKAARIARREKIKAKNRVKDHELGLDFSFDDSDDDGDDDGDDDENGLFLPEGAIECSSQLAISPLERVCELMQTLSSLAMEVRGTVPQ